MADVGCVSLFVNLAQTSPLAELFVVVNLDQIDSMLGTESFDQLHVHLFIAVVGENAQQSLAFV